MSSSSLRPDASGPLRRAAATPLGSGAPHRLQLLLPQGRRVLGDPDAGRAHRLELALRVALAARDDRPGVAHAPPRRGGAAGDEARDRLRRAGRLEERRRVLLGRAADLADHDDALGPRIAQEHLEGVDELHPLHRIAADPDAGRLSQAGPRGLRHRLVGERSGAGYNADLARLVDVARHDTDLALARRDDARAVRPDQTRGRALQRPLNLHHVQHRDALGDADDERHLGADRLDDRVGREGRRHVDHGGVAAGLLARILDGVEHRQAEVRLPALPGRHAAHHAGAVGDRLLGVECALGAGEALADDLGGRVDQDGHQAAPFTAFTTFWAASARSSAGMIESPDSDRMRLPRSTFVPSSLTTSGTFRFTSRAAATTPSAITSQRMMPPKMLTSTPSTFGSESNSLKAAVTRSLVAPPPTSRKFAGSPPNSLMMSMVAMASPAPLTMQAMLPSSLM